MKEEQGKWGVLMEAYRNQLPPRNKWKNDFKILELK